MKLEDTVIKNLLISDEQANKFLSLYNIYLKRLNIQLSDIVTERLEAEPHDGEIDADGQIINEGEFYNTNIEANATTK